MSHVHSIYDTDNHYIIDPVTRTISTTSAKNVLMQGDHNSERFTFEVPRTIEGHDMFQCDLIEIHYENASSGRGDISADFYHVDDAQLSADDPSVMIFSWLISGSVAKYVGRVAFSIRFVCTNDESETVYVWNTAKYTGVKVKASLNNTEQVLEDHSDFVARMEHIAESAMESIHDYEELASRAVSVFDGNTEKFIQAEQTLMQNYEQIATEATQNYEEGTDKIVQAVSNVDEYLDGYKYKELVLDVETGDWVVVIDNLSCNDPSSTLDGKFRFPNISVPILANNGDLIPQTGSLVQLYINGSLVSKQRWQGFPHSVTFTHEGRQFEVEFDDTDLFMKIYSDVDTPFTISMELFTYSTEWTRITEADLSFLFDSSSDQNFEIEFDLFSTYMDVYSTSRAKVDRNYVCQSLINDAATGMLYCINLYVEDYIDYTNSNGDQCNLGVSLFMKAFGLMSAAYEDGKHVLKPTDGYTFQLATDYGYVERMRIYKITNSLKARVSDVLDDINGEVV